MKDIYSLSPINKTAGLVVSNGEHFNPQKEFPSVFKSIPKIRHGGTRFLRVVFGRLSVIGFHDGNRKTAGKWVCRCTCGNYIICTGKRIRQALENPSLIEKSMCDECDYLCYIKSGRKASDAITGKSIRRKERKLQKGDGNE